MPLKYLSHYPLSIQNQVQTMLQNDGLGQFIRQKYPTTHQINNDQSLREFVLAIKNRFIKKSSPINKVVFDGKIHVINNALGLHSYVTRQQGNKFKSSNEIRISEVFKHTPEAFLTMIAVHEIAHIKEKEHNKAFYQLCQHMLPDYHQIEFDVRLYLTQLELKGDVYST